MTRRNARLLGQPSLLAQDWRWVWPLQDAQRPPRHRVWRHPAVALPGAVAGTVATMYLISWLLATLWPAAM